MALKIAFFDSHSYDETSFAATNANYGFDIQYYKEHLSLKTVPLAKGADVVCIFVNAECNAQVIEKLVEYGVKLIALRCAGFNNVDLKAAKGRIDVVHVPAYSPYAVAEYAVALMLSLNRKIYRAVNRTREGNFRLKGIILFLLIFYIDAANLNCDFALSLYSELIHEQKYLRLHRHQN